MSVPLEVDKKRTGLRWKATKPKKYKFVDDGMLVVKMNMETAHLVRGGNHAIKSKHDLPTQNLFRREVERATRKEMVVNSGKTRLLCISDVQMYKAVGYIEDADGNRLESGSAMKVLGFHFDSRPTCHAHVEALRKRMRERTWILRHLGKAGFS